MVGSELRNLDWNCLEAPGGLLDETPLFRFGNVTWHLFLTDFCSRVFPTTCSNSPIECFTQKVSSKFGNSSKPNYSHGIQCFRTGDPSSILSFNGSWTKPRTSISTINSRYG